MIHLRVAARGLFTMSKKAFIKHIVSYYPENIEENPIEGRITHKVGIYRRPTALPNECASDLAVGASEELFKKYNYDRSQIDCLIFCTQTPDYIMPATSCVIQGRLGLAERCMVIDYNHGCSGYVYGLSMAKGLIESGQANNVLLLTADTMSKLVHPKDMRTKPLFGDAAAATLISGTYSRVEYMRNFRFGTNGADFRKIIIHYGGFRMKYADPAIAHEEVADQYGNIRTDATVYMDGKGVVQFTQTVVPPMVQEILRESYLSINDVTNFIFHQANKFMLESVQKACKIPEDGRYFNNCSNIGNTASASIPNAINHMQEMDIKLGKHALLMGFGVGLTWAGCLVDLTTVE